MTKRGSKGPLQSKWLMIGALVVAVLMGAGRVGSGLIDRTGPDPVPNVNCAEAIAWDEAGDFAGEVVTVRGPVVGVAYLPDVGGQPTFLNIGRDHPDPERFTVVIWGDQRAGFPDRPEVLFAGREVCIAGEIRIHEGSPQIELAGTGAIEYANQAGTSPQSIGRLHVSGYLALRLMAG
jgi:hypothetical protein